MPLASDVSAHLACDIHDAGSECSLSTILVGIAVISRTSWRALRAQDGLVPTDANSGLFASTKLARPNRLNNCAEFLAKPL